MVRTRHGETDLPANRSLFRMVLAPSVWALHFLLCYCTAAIVCAKGIEYGWATGLIGAYTLGGVAVVVVIGWQAWRQWDFMDDRDYIHGGNTDEDRREFLGHVGFFLSCLSVIGMIYVALPAAFIGSCT